MLAANELSTFALAIAGTGVVLAAVLIANPPLREGSALFRRWTVGLPAAAAASLSEAEWKRLVRTYYAGVIGVLVVEAIVLRWAVPAPRVLPFMTLCTLAVVLGARRLIRRWLLRRALPLA